MIRKIVSSTLAAAVLLGAFATLSGCNTVQGMGRDIEKGGEKVQQEAVEHKRY